MESLRLFRQLVTLTETGNYRKAAEKLGITHSALSQAVKRLEESYGVPLFARSEGQLVPTSYGELVISTARETLDRFAGMEREIGLIKKFEEGRLCVAVDPFLSGTMATALGQLVNKFPKLRFSLKAGYWVDILEDIRARRVDMYFGLMPDSCPADIQFEKIPLLSPVVTCRAGHPLAVHDTIRAMDILPYPVVSGNGPDWFIARIQKAFPDFFPTLQSVRDQFLITHDISVLPLIIANSDAVAIAPRRIMNIWLETGRAVTLNLEDPPSPGGVGGMIAIAKGRLHSPAALALRTEILQVLGVTQ